MRKWVKLSLGLTWLLLLGGCAPRQEAVVMKPDVTIGVVTKASDSEYWQSFLSGLEKAAEDYQVNIIHLSPKSETDGQIQKVMIEELLQKDIDVLAVSPIDSQETSYLDLAASRGIPVYACDTKITGRDIPYIGADNYRMGWEMGKYMSGFLGGGGKVGIIAGSLQQEGHKARVEGFGDYLSQYTNIEIAFLKDRYSNLLISQKEITEMINNNPEIGGIFITNAVTAMGVSDYLSREGHHLVICATDSQQDALEALRQGELYALANHSGYDNGYCTVEQIVKTVRNGEAPKDCIIDVDMLTKDNIETVETAGKQDGGW